MHWEGIPIHIQIGEVQTLTVENWEWWNNHKEQLNHEHTKNIACTHCGKEFIVYENSQQKYCSHACYIKERFGGKNAAG